MEGNLANWNILVADGKESKRDFLSSGERTEISLNLFYFPLGKKVLKGYFLPLETLDETIWLNYVP